MHCWDGSMTAHQSLGFLDMFMTEEELTIEIAKIDRIQIDNMYLAEACKDEVLEKLTTNSSCSDHQDSRLKGTGISVVSYRLESELAVLIFEYKAPRDCFGKRSRPIVAM